MKPFTLFRSTLNFTLAKSLLGIVMILLSVLTLLLMLGIGRLFSLDGMFVAFILWLGSIRGVHYLVMYYFGYLIKAGHIAVLSEAVTTGVIPDRPVSYGMEKVKERFLEASVYFAVDQLVTGAVKQIQRGINKLGNALDFIPGISQITSLAGYFVELSLGYIDECCLAYSFYRKDQGAFQSACDGVVLYAQNIKPLLKNAALTMLKVAALMAAVALLVFLPLRGIFAMLHWSPLIAFVLSCMIAWTIKFSFVDSYILCSTMTRYMELASGSAVSYDLYAKLCNISSNFRKLWNKGQGESDSVTSAPVTASAASGQSQRFCTRCGTSNAPQSHYCRGCGTPF